MAATNLSSRKTGCREVNRSPRLRNTLVAISGSLAALPVAALELGDVNVHSTLGQPLRASISYALAPNEQLDNSCVSILSAPASSGLPAFRSGSVAVSNGVITITGSGAMREPLASMRLAVRCPYTPQLTREYMLFVNPSETIAAPATQVTASDAGVARPASRPARSATPAVAAAAVSEPVAAASRYRVQPGDTLSGIAQRIDNRPVGLWPAANAIFAANPDAFVDGDMNRLKAGTWLEIPDFGSGEALTVAPAPVAAAAPVEAAPAANVYSPQDVAEPAAPAEPEPVSILDPTFSAAALPADSTATSQPGEPATDELQPGDIVTQPLPAIADETVIIPDTELEGPATASTQPNGTMAIIRTPEPAESGSTNWLAWFAGGGIALIASLLAFGWFRKRFGSTPVGAAAEPEPQRRATDTQRVEAIADVDFDLDDDAPTAENLALDADLVTGTGFEEGSAVDVTEDFAFASTTNLDIELPDEMSSQPDQFETDIIPPLNIDTESILESEVLPEEEADDYDMSVIVDATQMPDPADVTERDLEAVEVADTDGTLSSDEYTLSQEADYKILEQDYEDELTATQRLNEEILRAAEDLASNLGEDGAGDTREMSTANVYELDLTAEMASQNDDNADDIDASDLTVSLEAGDKTVEMAEDNTVEMPKRGKAG
jgi:hypothetical protein